MEYQIFKQTDKVVEVIFIDPNSELTHNRTINIGDLSTDDQIKERINDHLRAFGHRVKVGTITEASLPNVQNISVVDSSGKPVEMPLEQTLPTAIVIDKDLTPESKAVLAQVIADKVNEQKTAKEEQLDKLKEDKKADETEVAKVQQDLTTITAAITDFSVIHEDIKVEVAAAKTPITDTMPTNNV
jgi:hypothetical protein